MALAYDATQVTRDVDAIFVPHRIVVEEARAVADELGLPPWWLNETSQRLAKEGHGIDVRLPTFHAEAADRTRAASTPDQYNGTPARLIPGPFNRPGSDVIYLFRRVINGSLTLALPVPT